MPKCSGFYIRPFRYAEPREPGELFELLAQNGGKACVLAGGTNVVVDLRSGRLRPEIVVRLGRVAGLHGRIERAAEGLRIGALATLAAIAEDDAVRGQYPALSQAAACMGSKQIRNRATLAGNVCNASPAADTAPPLLIYGAKAEILSCRGCRRVLLESFFTGPRKTALQADEIVGAILLPPPPQNSGSCYLRASRRAGMDLAIVGAAALAAQDGEVRIALGAVGPTPLRAREAEARLRERRPGEAPDAGVWEALAGEISPIDDIRASAEYRRAMAVEYAKRAFAGALQSLGRNVENEPWT